MRKFTNWDRFKDDKKICESLGCDEDARWFCCPDLDCCLCLPKKKYLKEIGVTEKDIDDGIVKIEDLT